MNPNNIPEDNSQTPSSKTNPENISSAAPSTSYTSNTPPNNEASESAVQDFSTLLSDIENFKKLKDMLNKNSNSNNNDNNSNGSDGTGTGTGSTSTFTANLARVTLALSNINTIKDELCKIPLDPCEKEYIDNSIFPLLNTMYLISTVSGELSGSVNVLTNSPIEHPKRSKLRDTIDLMYDLNEQCEDINRVVKRRLKALLED